MPICPIARDSLPEPDYHLMVDLVAITSIRAGEIPMNKTVDCTRRDLVKLTAGTVLAAAAGAAWAAEESALDKPPAAGRPKISSVSWNFHHLGAGNSRAMRRTRCRPRASATWQ
jgi:hypothetical protein